MVREVRFRGAGGGLGGVAQPPPCSKNKEFCFDATWEPSLKRKVAVTLPEFPILLQQK